MKTAEQSACSRSSTEGSMTFAQAIKSSAYHGKLFPFFDQMSQKAELPESIYILPMIFFIAQSIFVPTWWYILKVWHNPGFAIQFTNYITAILYFKPVDQTDEGQMIRSIIYLLLFLVVVFTLVYQQIVFQKKRRYTKVFLKVCRILLEIVPILMIHPTAGNLGNLFVIIANGKHDAATILWFILAIFEFGVFTFVFIEIFMMLGVSPYLSSKIFASYNISVFVTYYVLSVITYLLSFVLSIFESWLIYVPIVIHIITSIVSIYRMLNRPFIGHNMNVNMTAVLFTYTFIDVMSAIIFWFPETNIFICIALIIVFLILSFVISHLIFKFQTKELKKCFSSEAISGAEDIQEYFKQIGLDLSERKANLALRFVLEVGSPYLLDFSVLKYSTAMHRTIEMYAQCIKIASFFPGEARMLNMLVNDFVHLKGLNTHYRFLVYQINRLKYLRQSSSSVSSAERLKEMTQNSKEVEEDVKSFWTRLECTDSYLLGLNSSTSANRSLWDETLVEFPNSVSHSEGYSHFLIESCTDFKGAVVQRHRANLIEGGRNFCVDWCYIHFVRNFPGYIKRSLLDLKGNIVRQTNRANGSKNSASSGKPSSDINLSSDLSSMDQQVEEEIGKSLFRHSRLRIALQTSTENKEAKNYKRLMLAIFFSTMVNLLVVVIIFGVFHTYFDDRSLVNDRIEFSNQVEYNFWLAQESLMFDLADNRGLFDFAEKVAKFNAIDAKFNVSPIMDLTKSWTYNTMLYGVSSRDLFGNFLSQVALMADEGQNIHHLVRSIVEPVLNFTFCVGGHPAPYFPSNLKLYMMNMYISQSLVNGDSDFNNWYTNNEKFCTLMKSSETISKAFDTIRESLSSGNTDEYISFKKRINLVMEILGPILIIATFVPLLIFLILFHYEIRDLIGILFSLDSEIKHSAINKIILTDIGDDTTTGSTEKGKGFNFLPFFIVITLILACVVVALLECHIYFNIQLTNTNFENMNIWAKTSRRRKTIIFKSMFFTTQSILLSRNGAVSSFTDADTIMDIAASFVAELDEANNIMIIGTDDTPPCINYDSEIDDLTLKERCNPDKVANNSDFHGMYMCGSAQHLGGYFKDLIYTIEADRRTYGGHLDDPVPLDFIHMNINHYIPCLIKIDNLLTKFSSEMLGVYKNDEIIFFICELIIVLIQFGLMMWISHTYRTIFKTILMVMRRVSPFDLVTNKKVTDFMLNRKTEVNTTNTAASASILQLSSDCILLTGLTGVIEVINPATMQLLGYTPEQLLGQSISCIIDDEEKSKVLSQMELMRNNECSSIYEDHTICLSDNDMKYPCSITILGMKDDSNDEIASFVFIFRDESDLIKQQNEAENAKKRSETLLYQILPRSIVVKLNQGEKDISFTVQSATIMFIDIVKFSEYAQPLTPQEIMCNLSLLFGAFDEALHKYPLLYKIKLIGDVYMCAGGLFDLDSPPASHAEQMIRFGLDCFQLLEDTNIKLNAVLSVRMGVNTGGPIIAGVLGTDKPVFDIIGDTINIASRLQSTDFPGSIQISEDTFNLVNELDFNIEPRGEVFLKGKGKKQAYLVKSTKGMFQLSETDLMLTSKSVGIISYDHIE